MSVVASLQAHQLVLTRELTEINNDIVALQQMGCRYEVQCGISFHPAVDHLVILRAEKERLLGQVNAQLVHVQQSVASSSQLVDQLNAFQGGTTQHYQHTLQSFPLPASAVRSVAPIVTPSRANVSNADIVSQSLYGPQVIHIQGPGGFTVSTNSTILANSPNRDR